MNYKLLYGDHIIGDVKEDDSDFPTFFGKYKLISGLQKKPALAHIVSYVDYSIRVWPLIEADRMDAIDYENVTYEEGLDKLINYSANIYHTPFDDLTQEINYDAVTQYLDFMKSLIVSIANDEKDPEWNPGTSYRIERLRSIAEKK